MRCYKSMTPLFGQRRGGFEKRNNCRRSTSSFGFFSSRIVVSETSLTRKIHRRLADRQHHHDSVDTNAMIEQPQVFVIPRRWSTECLIQIFCRENNFWIIESFEGMVLFASLSWYRCSREAKFLVVVQNNVALCDVKKKWKTHTFSSASAREQKGSLQQQMKIRVFPLVCGWKTLKRDDDEKEE